MPSMLKQQNVSIAAHLAKLWNDEMSSWGKGFSLAGRICNKLRVLARMLQWKSRRTCLDSLGTSRDWMKKEEQRDL